MVNTYKVAGQAAPIADTDTELYKVPANMEFLASTLVICNRSLNGDASIFRIAIVPDGQVLGNKHYIAYDQFIDPRKSKDRVIGITLSANDSVYVRSNTANLSFTLFGTELS